MMRLPSTLALVVALAPAWAGSASAFPGCNAFLEKLRAEASELQLDYSHALVVSRAHTDGVTFDIVTKSDVDGTLMCSGDRFQRFEAHVTEPATPRATTGFDRLQAAALRAALGWDAGKSKSTLRSMASDAKEYYAASKERGDVYVAGKTEEHVSGGVSLGMIHTDVDRAFVIVGPE